MMEIKQYKKKVIGSHPNKLVRIVTESFNRSERFEDSATLTVSLSANFETRALWTDESLPAGAMSPDLGSSQWLHGRGSV